MGTLVMCIGNRDNGDDGIGPYVADIFPETEGIKVIDCGIVPENFTHLTKDANRIIMVDAVDMGLSPGDIRIVPRERIPLGSISTHNMPLSLLMEYLEMEGKEVILIGIQPEGFEGELSEKVKDAGRKVVDIIRKGNISDIEVLE